MLDKEVLKLNLQRLKECVCDALGFLGYTAMSDGGEAGPSGEQGYPFGRIAPMEVVSVEGRSEGLVTCGLDVRLSALSASADPSAVEQAEDTLRCDAVALYSVVADDDAVCSVSGFRCTPDRGRQSPHGEVGVRVRFRAGVRIGPRRS